MKKYRIKLQIITGAARGIGAGIATASVKKEQKL
jgi:short-subunit dehydrogenase